MSKIIDYVFITGDEGSSSVQTWSIEGMERKIKNLLMEGWELWGSPMIRPAIIGGKWMQLSREATYVQAMIKRESEDSND